METKDPWNWSAAEVGLFFRHSLHRLTTDLPNPVFPDKEYLATQLEAHQVSGSYLLLYVDRAFLKDECAVCSFAALASVEHAISRLRGGSIEYDKRKNAAQPALPEDLLPLGPTITEPPSLDYANLSEVGTNVRPNEKPVTDGTGRKRRKLSPSALISRPIPSKIDIPSVGYCRDTKLPLDDLFYESTPVGGEILEDEPQDTQYTHHDWPHDEHETFHLTPTHTINSGDAQYVNRNLRYFLWKPRLSGIKYRGKRTVARYPYRVGKTEESLRSVSLFQYEETPIREKANTLSFQQDFAIEPTSGSAWERLLQNHQASPNEKVVFVDHDSSDGESQDEVSSDDASDSDMAEEDEGLSAITEEQALEILGKIIEEMILKWETEKKPRYEEKNARSIWRQMHGKRSVREYLISRSRATIRKYSSRLRELQDELMKESWTSEQQLRAQSGSLEVTVYDREQEQWRISVWQRKQEPEGVNRPRKLSTQQRGDDEMEEANQAVASAEDLSGFIEDDCNLDDTKNTGLVIEDDALDFSFINQQIEEDVFQHTGSGQEEPAGDSHHSDATPTPTVIGDSSEPAETPASFEDTHMSDANDQFSSASQDDQLQEGLDDLDHTEVVNSPTKAPDAKWSNADAEEETRVDSDADLPSPSSFRPRLSQMLTQPPPSPREVIELSSDPPEPEDTKASRLKVEGLTPLPRHHIKQEKQIAFSSDPDTDSIHAIRQWDFAVLDERDDRKRIIMKLIFELNRDDQIVLRDFLKQAPRDCFDAVEIACNILPSEPEQYLHTTLEHSRALRIASRLYICWEHADHELLKAPAEFFTDGQNLPQSFEYTNLQPWHQTMKVTLSKIQRYVVGIRNPILHLANKTDRLRRAEDDLEKGRKIVIVLSDTESDPDKKNNKKKKKVQKINRDAEVLRNKAQKRALAHSQQSSNTAQLSQMVADGENTNDVITIYAPEEGDGTTQICLNRGLSSRLKPHQIEGVRFAWRELTADDEEGQGCILAHTMGLGKTAQSIALLVTIAETAMSPELRKQLPKMLRKKQRNLILCPPNLLSNWQNELQTWDPAGVLGATFMIDATVNNNQERFEVLHAWRKAGGVLLIGYQLFTRIVDCKLKSSREGDSGLSEDQSLKAMQYLTLHSTLVIADEAHTFKNEKTKVSRAAQRFFTQRRIALTGSPMSNNIQEIYALVSWAAPGYLSSSEEFRSSYGTPIEQGTYLESTAYERRRSMKKLAALKEIIAPKLQRADITVLKGAIKQKVEYVLTVPLTAAQVKPYTRYVALVLGGPGEEGNEITQAKLFGWLSTLGLVCNHPWAFRKKLLEEKKAPKAARKKRKISVSTTEPATEPAGTARGGSPSGDISPVDDEGDTALVDAHISAQGIDDLMVQQLLPLLPETSLEEFSHKAQLCRRIIELSVAVKDKVLLFSHSIPTLDYLAGMVGDMGLRYGRIQGDTSPKEKTRTLANMEKGAYDVLVVSTRAGGQGLNIQSANRVVIFNFGFNPQWEEQAIGRAYRLGQEKPVFVYRFVAGGTFETMLNNKALFKTGLASRVVDKKNPVRNAERHPSAWLFAPKTLAQKDVCAQIGKDPHVLDVILSQHGNGHDTFIREVTTMETLQEEADDVPLTAEEQAEVLQEIQQAQALKSKKGFPSTAPPAFSTSQRAEASGSGMRPGTQA